jgi:outer membrane cobalamin receptor
VFNADAGTSEPAGATYRHGLEFILKAKLLDWLTFTGNVTSTTARFANGNAVPVAPGVTAFTDLTARFPWGLSASISFRYLSRRWADEDRTQIARGYALWDFGARYRYKLGAGTFLDAFVTIDNMFSTKWRDIQLFYTSRLRSEPPDGVPDIHYLPGNPRTVLGGLALRF